MPELAISRADLWPEPVVPEALFRIAGVMLAPHDGDRGREFERRVHRNYALVRLSGADPYYVNILRDAEPTRKTPADDPSHVARLMLRGACAGAILIAALQKPKRKLDDVKTQVGQGLQMKRTAVEESWREFRCVAHLYAAYGAWCAEYRRRGVPDFFPCRIENLREFLAFAEDARIRGEIQRPNRSGKGTLLQPDETWRLPPGLLQSDQTQSVH